jgi:chromosome segregation and condensation protein ScpB
MNPTAEQATNRILKENNARIMDRPINEFIDEQQGRTTFNSTETMINPDDIISEGTRIVSPPRIKRERSDDEEPARRVAQRTEEEAEEISDEFMRKIVLEDLWSDDEETLDQTMKRLVKYMDKADSRVRCVEKQNAFFEVGGHLAVVRTMKGRPTHKNLQISGIFLLGIAAYENPLIQTAIGMVEGVQAILAAMQTFSSEGDVIGSGFGALCNIVCHHEANANLLVKKIGAIPFLVERMTEFKADQTIMRRACKMLRNASRFEPLREAIVNADALLALGSAIKSHKDNAQIRHVTREAMQLLV